MTRPDPVAASGNVCAETSDNFRKIPTYAELFADTATPEEVFAFCKAALDLERGWTHDPALVQKLWTDRVRRAFERVARANQSQTKKP